MKGLRSISAIALLFGLVSSAGIITLIQFLIPDAVKVLPLAVGLIAFFVIAKKRSQDVGFRELLCGAIVLIFVAITIVYGYIVSFYWISPSHNPLSLSVPIWDHAIRLTIILAIGSGVAVLLAMMFSRKWGWR